MIYFLVRCKSNVHLFVWQSVTRRWLISGILLVTIFPFFGRLQQESYRAATWDLNIEGPSVFLILLVTVEVAVKLLKGRRKMRKKTRKLGSSSVPSMANSWRHGFLIKKNCGSEKSGAGLRIRLISCLTLADLCTRCATKSPDDWLLWGCNILQLLCCALG